MQHVEVCSRETISGNARVAYFSQLGSRDQAHEPVQQLCYPAWRS